MASQLKTEASSLALHVYQAFWATVSQALVQRYRGKSVAVEFGEDGWQIIDGADDIEQLRDSLLASGVDLDTLVFDRIPDEEEEECTPSQLDTCGGRTTCGTRSKLRDAACPAKEPQPPPGTALFRAPLRLWSSRFPTAGARLRFS